MDKNFSLYEVDATPDDKIAIVDLFRTYSRGDPLPPGFDVVRYADREFVAIFEDRRTGFAHFYDVVLKVPLNRGIDVKAQHKLAAFVERVAEAMTDVAEHARLYSRQESTLKTRRAQLAAAQEAGWRVAQLRDFVVRAWAPREIVVEDFLSCKRSVRLVSPKPQ